MKIENVRSMPPKLIFRYWIREREKIRIRKESGKPKPWTDDEILQNYRFCNVVRADDKVSRWLTNNWYKPNFNHRNMLVAASLARNVNNPDTLEVIGFPRRWNRQRVKKILDDRQKQGVTNFSGAYLVVGTLGGTRIHQIVDKVVHHVYKNPPDIDTSSMEKSVEVLLDYPGFSTFIGGQVVADLRWAMKGSWKDRKTWAPIGPGSSRGIHRLLGRDYTSTKVRQKQFNQELPQVIEMCKTRLPTKITKRMEAIDYQNCLCEFDKYCRALYGQGRPKRNYAGV